MIEKILQAYNDCTFDFRTIACDSDPLRHLFPDWVDYYRMKAAIAKALKPASILEVGVRYGYSAAAFLSGSPNAAYVGIDLDSNEFGGCAGALDYARARLPGDVTLIQGNTQTMVRFPGERYDLIHIDGQQDEIGFFRDMDKAVRQARYILVDGYFWTRDNFNASNDFLLKYRDLIEYALVIPGYGGELLLSVRAGRTELSPSFGRTSTELRSLYDTRYYEKDCGGWEFQRGGTARLLEDGRLRAIFNLAMGFRPRTLLDVGCGRGELCRQAALSGVECTGLDYSEAAIGMAQNLSRSLPPSATPIRWLCDDLANVPAEEKFDVVVMSDVVEHLSVAEMQACFAKIRTLLSPTGVLVLHTFPNLWFYRYDYERRRRAARTLGAYLPAEPRSRMEREMHINECNPRHLRRALRAAFPAAELWFGSPESPVASLACRLSPRQLAAQRDLFALASLGTISTRHILNLHGSEPLTRDAAAGLTLRLTIAAGEGRAQESQVYDVTVSNFSGHAISSLGSHPTFLSYHWLNASDRRIIVFEGHRNRLSCTQVSESTVTHPMVIQLPSQPGQYLLQVTLVQERIAWLDDWNPRCRGEVLFSIT